MPDSVPRPRIRELIRDVSSSERSDVPETITDQELMVRLSDGEVEALEGLYDRYSSLVFSIVVRVLTDRQLAEDVTQEVFLRLWRRPWSYDPERGKFRSWLMSVTRHR